MTQSPVAKLATVIGGTGFIGRQIVRRLARDGYRVRVTSRRPSLALSMKPLGDVGQIVLVRADIASEADILAAVHGADVVVNLVGILRPSEGRSFEAMHAMGAADVAKACKKSGVDKLVHVSAIGADPLSGSSYARTKGEGEVAVREFFPGAVILRPSIVFGPGDGFFNMFASLMRRVPVAFPLLAGGRTRFQPVYVGDVADAVGSALANPQARGRTYELGGPAVYTMEQLVRYIASVTKRPRVFFPVPSWLLELGAAATGWLPFAPLTLDQARLLRRDNVVKSGPDAAALGTLADLGISATPLETVVPGYLIAYRPTGQYAQSNRAAP